MKKHLTLLLISIIAILASSCHNLYYKYDKFKTVRSTHKDIAFIPFELTIDPQSLPLELPVNEFKALQKEEASFLQNFAYSVFMKKAEKNKYRVDFQNIIETNKYILDSSFNYAKFTFENPSKLATKCNTDIVLLGTFYRSNPILASGNYKNRLDAKFSIFDENGKLIWEMHTYKSRKSTKSSIHVSKKIIKKLARRFPYKYKLFEKRNSSVAKIM